MSLQFSAVLEIIGFPASGCRRFPRGVSRLVALPRRLYQALQYRLAAPRRAAEFAAIDDRTLRDIGLHRSTIPLILRAKP